MLHTLRCIRSLRTELLLAYRQLRMATARAMLALVLLPVAATAEEEIGMHLYHQSRQLMESDADHFSLAAGLPPLRTGDPPQIRVWGPVDGWRGITPIVGYVV